MRSCSVVMFTPSAGEGADLLKAAGDIAVQKLIAQARVEAFDIAVLPRAAGLEMEGSDAEPAKPLANWVGDELGAVVGSDSPAQKLELALSER